MAATASDSNGTRLVGRCDISWLRLTCSQGANIMLGGIVFQFSELQLAICCPLEASN